MEAMVRQMFRSKVRKGLYALSFASDGREALERLRSEDGAAVDVLVTDINMPKMTGLDLLEAMRDVDCDAKAIVVSAYGDMSNIRSAMNLGAFDFITKPVDFDDLELTIERTQRYLLRRREALARQSELLMLEQELEVARAVQRSIHPGRTPTDSRFDLHVTIDPLSDFGGDFFDLVRLEGDRIGLLVATVSSQGIPGAMLMMNARSVFKGAAIGERCPSRVLARMNEVLIGDLVDGANISLLYLVYDPLDGGLDYACAGRHPPAFVFTRDGTLRGLPSPGGPAIGHSSRAVYEQSRSSLAQDATLLVLSYAGLDLSGSAEASVVPDMLSYIPEVGSSRASAEQTVQSVVDTLRRHTGHASIDSDLGCLALRRLA